MIKCAAEIGILTKNVKFRLEKPELGERLVVSGGMKADVRRVTPPHTHALVRILRRRLICVIYFTYNNVYTGFRFR